MKRCVLPLCLLLLAASAAAELQLSLTLTGTPEEIIRAVEVLREAGLVADGGEAPGTPLTIESTTSQAELDAARQESTKVVVGNALASPPNAKAGTPMLVTIDVLDAARRVDTISAVLGENLATTDLYDNGTNGDVTPGDGRWSALLMVPPRIAAGSHEIVFTPYDAKGAPLTAPGPDGTEVPLLGKVYIAVTN